MLNCSFKHGDECDSIYFDENACQSNGTHSMERGRVQSLHWMLFHHIFVNRFFVIRFVQRTRHLMRTHTFYTQNYVHTFDTLPILCYILFNNVLALDHASRQDKLWWLLLLLVFLLCTQHSRPDATIELVPSIQTHYNFRRESPVRDVHNYYSNWLIFHLISVIRLY